MERETDRQIYTRARARARTHTLTYTESERQRHRETEIMRDMREREREERRDCRGDLKAEWFPRPVSTLARGLISWLSVNSETKRE